MTRAAFKFRPTSPIEVSSHDIGLAIANTKIVGASKRKIGIGFFPFWPEENNNDIISKNSTDNRNRQRQCQDQRVSLQKIVFESTGIVLESRQRRKRYLAHC